MGEQKLKIDSLTQSLYNTEQERENLLSQFLSSTSQINLLNESIKKVEEECNNLKIFHGNELDNLTQSYNSGIESLQFDFMKAIKEKEEQNSNLLKEIEQSQIITPNTNDQSSFQNVENEKLQEELKKARLDIKELEKANSALLSYNKQLLNKLEDLTKRNEKSLDNERLVEDLRKKLRDTEHSYSIRVQALESNLHEELDNMQSKLQINTIYLNNILQNWQQNKNGHFIFEKRDNSFYIVTNTGEKIELYVPDNMDWLGKNFIMCKIIDIDITGKKYTAFGDEYNY